MELLLYILIALVAIDILFGIFLFLKIRKISKIGKRVGDKKIRSLELDISSLEEKWDEEIEWTKQEHENIRTEMKMQKKDLEEKIDGIDDYFDEDVSFEEAKEIVIESGKASASLLQRRLRIGYENASRLIDKLEEEGVIGPAEGSKPREILVEE